MVHHLNWLWHWSFGLFLLCRKWWPKWGHCTLKRLGEKEKVMWAHRRCDSIPSGYFHLLCMLNQAVLSAALPFYPRPCPAPVSSDSPQFPAGLLSQWRIKVGSIKGKQGGIHSIVCICTLYLLAMANPCELDEAGNFVYVPMNKGSCCNFCFVLAFTHNNNLSINIEFCSHHCIIILLFNKNTVPGKSNPSIIQDSQF